MTSDAGAYDGAPLTILAPMRSKNAAHSGIESGPVRAVGSFPDGTIEALSRFGLRIVEDCEADRKRLAFEVSQTDLACLGVRRPCFPGQPT